MRILIVEDEFNLADVISSRLKKEKYKDISINGQQQDEENISEKKAEEKKWLENIKSESERMNNLISNLCELAKSESGIKEQYSNENLSKLVEKSVLTFESLSYEKNIKLDYNF